MDLSKMDQGQLERLRKDIDKELNRRYKDGVKEAQKRARQLAEAYGLTVQDLVGGPAAAKSGGSIRFQHPDDSSKTWSGRGRKPGWVKEWEAAGQSVEELRVD